MRAEHRFLRARAVLLVAGEKQTAAEFINFAGELEGERVFAGGKFGWQSEAKQLLLLVDLDSGLFYWFVVDRCAGDFYFRYVQDNFTDRCANLELDRFRPGERQLVDIRNNPDGIINRDNLLRQLSGRAREIEWFFPLHACRKNRRDQEK